MVRRPWYYLLREHFNNLFPNSLTSYAHPPVTYTAGPRTIISCYVLFFFCLDFLFYVVPETTISKLDLDIGYKFFIPILLLQTSASEQRDQDVEGGGGGFKRSIFLAFWFLLSWWRVVLSDFFMSMFLNCLFINFGILAYLWIFYSSHFSAIANLSISTTKRNVSHSTPIN